MNPLATELNEQIKKSAPAVFELLSKMGQRLFFPKGILFQSAEAAKKAHRFNATIGTAVEKGQPMHLKCTRKFFNNLEPGEIYPYAPPAGRPLLRKLWKDKMFRENPGLMNKQTSQPVVTSAITHGLTLVADLFVEKDDVILSPDQLWGNYRLIYEARNQAKIQTFSMFDQKGGLDLAAFEEILGNLAEKHKKIILILNFPNNPTGYTPSLKEAEGIRDAVLKRADKGTRFVVLCDDSYFGLFYEDSIRESVFSFFADLSENVLAIKLDGATKEDYAWGFRTGFITYAVKTENPQELYEALEKKTCGLIRAQISNCNHASQSIIEKVLSDPQFKSDHQEKYQIMLKRALRVKEVLRDSRFEPYWDLYPFNSGYFLCLKLKKLNAEDLRTHLLEKYGVGCIANNDTDLRVAISCIEEEDLSTLFDLIYQGARDLSGGLS
ncbi:MAG: aminotransferase class I/II-fold pyridoxal phosphate-dependent enzyme [Deltaproteobacteria bacterium]|nr:aminotransferase class I/II-fold pyridoxal phosphate-dependent enzyme [Deltaproteobacteria bacterium]